MTIQIPFKLLSVILVLVSHCSLGQAPDEGDVKFAGGEKIVFYEHKVRDTVYVSGTARVFFKDSTSLVPRDSYVTIMRMKGAVCLLYFYSQEKRLSALKKDLLEKYAAKVDSIFLNGTYQFYGDKKWIVGKKLDFTYSFKLAPKSLPR